MNKAPVQVGLGWCGHIPIVMAGGQVSPQHPNGFMSVTDEDVALVYANPAKNGSLGIPKGILIRDLVERIERDDAEAIFELAAICAEDTIHPAKVIARWLEDVEAFGEVRGYRQLLGRDLWSMSQAGRALRRAVRSFTERNIAARGDIWEEFTEGIAFSMSENPKNPEFVARELVYMAMGDVAFTNDRIFDVMTGRFCVYDPHARAQVYEVRLAKTRGVSPDDPSWRVSSWTRAISARWEREAQRRAMIG